MRYELIHIPVLFSTNNEASALIRKGLPDKDHVIMADYQTHGRGRGDHRWDSDSGSNLLASWVMFPEFLSVDHQFQLSKVTSLGIIEMLKEWGMEAMIKWPNDILVGDRKIAGILIEVSVMGNKLRACVAGMGINVNQRDFPAFALPATSMQLETGRGTNVKVVLDRLMEALYRYYDMLISGNSYAIDDLYLQYLRGLNGQSTFSMENEEFNGIIRGVSALGELLVERSGRVGAYGLHTLHILPDRQHG